MIDFLELKNFKSWSNTGEIKLAPLTALFGTNSSGKTSILQSLLMLKQTTESSDRRQALHLGDDRSLVNLGTFPEMLFKHDLNNKISLRIGWIPPGKIEVKDPTQKNKVILSGQHLILSTQVAWMKSGDKSSGHPVVEKMSYAFGGSEFGMEKKHEKEDEYSLFTNPQKNYKFKRYEGRPWALPTPIKCYGFPDKVTGYYQNAEFLSELELAFENLCSSVFYLGPLREHPKRQYTWAGSRPEDMGRRGEGVVDALLSSRDKGETFRKSGKRDRVSLEELIALWLRDLGLIDSFSVKPIKEDGQLFQVWVKRHPDAADVLLTDVGFGVSQILPVLALCYYAPEGSTIILEQPEIHLHPMVQAGLADVFIDAIKTRNVQIILESHSEHLLRRLQRRVAEDVLPTEKAALYFCSLSNGESVLKKLDLDMFGTIQNWPEDFFGDEMGEIAATNQAAMKRKKVKQQ